MSNIKINWNEIKYFKPSEFNCNCCGKSAISEKLVKMLDNARDIAGVTFRLNSAYRCDVHNKRVGGVKDSSHVLGLAVDIHCNANNTRLAILRGLIKAGFTRIGIYRTFIHADIDTSKPNNIWLG